MQTELFLEAENGWTAIRKWPRARYKNLKDRCLIDV